MIQKRTVFVVGAGASAPFGLPLGSDLVQTILSELRTKDSLLLRSLRLAGHQDPTVQQFREALQGSALTSIDTFLEGNLEEYVQIGKKAIAFVILQREATCRQKNTLWEPLPDHWLRYLWNALRTGSTADTLQANNVSFITFNYDRIIETYFDTVLQHSFRVSPSHASAMRQAALPIFHLHGRIAVRPFGDAAEAALLGEINAISSDIKVVSDSVSLTDSAFLDARGKISVAHSVYFLGFGYHPVNIARLQMQSTAQPNARVAGSTVKMGDAEILEAQARLGRDLITSASANGCEAFLRACAPLTLTPSN